MGFTGILLAALVVVCAVLVIGLTISFGLICIGLCHGFKIISELIFADWTSLAKLLAKGCSEYWCRLLLPGWFKAGRLEIRIAENISDDEWQLVQEEGFARDTIEFHIFRLVLRGPRRRKKLVEPAPSRELAPVHT